MPILQGFLQRRFAAGTGLVPGLSTLRFIEVHCRKPACRYYSPCSASPLPDRPWWRRLSPRMFGWPPPSCCGSLRASMSERCYGSASSPLWSTSTSAGFRMASGPSLTIARRLHVAATGLLLLTAPANAADTLPDTMMGDWVLDGREEEGLVRANPDDAWDYQIEPIRSRRCGVHNPKGGKASGQLDVLPLRHSFCAVSRLAFALNVFPALRDRDFRYRRATFRPEQQVHSSIDVPVMPSMAAMANPSSYSQAFLAFRATARAAHRTACGTACLLDFNVARSVPAGFIAELRSKLRPRCINGGFSLRSIRQ